MKTIVQSLAIEYQDEGNGPVILMLHGWKDTLHTFDAIVTDLCHSHRVVRIDLPGFGGSEMPIGVWSIEAYVRFVREFIQKLHLDVDTFVGHSFGGRIAIRGTGEGVFQSRRLILIAAAGLAHRRMFRNKVLSGLAKVGKLLTLIPPFSFWRNELRRTLYTSIGSDYFNAGALKDTFVKVVSEDLSSFAEKITVPTLIIWGENDSTTPAEQAERIHSLVRGSKLTVINHAGHFLHQERPEEVTAAISTFLT